ncbi:hypothetical protein GF385_04100 [Candidatus Dependentiae bacterium]|nr:hypothetical protein [Candidatus Dependentiae bacterium]
MFEILKKPLLFAVLILFLFPSCIKYYKISNMEFHQGYPHEDELEAIDGNRKTTAIYDQFITQAIFDVLYLSDSVRFAYVDKYCEKRGLGKETKKSLQARELELNKNWITFYVLADIRDKKHVSLTDKNSAWSLYLRFKDKRTIRPLSIREVDLAPEYQYLFGPLFNRFKRYYEVKFAARDSNNNYYIKNKEPFDLVVSSAYKESFLTFNEPKTPIKKPKKKENTKKCVCEYCESIINRKATKKSRLKKIDYKKEQKPKKTRKIKKRKLLKDEDFYWI